MNRPAEHFHNHAVTSCTVSTSYPARVLGQPFAPHPVRHTVRFMKHQPRKDGAGTRREQAEALLAKYELSEAELFEELHAGRLHDPELLEAAECLGESTTGPTTRVRHAGSDRATTTPGGPPDR